MIRKQNIFCSLIIMILAFAGNFADANKKFLCPIAHKKFWISSLFGLRKNPNGSTRFHYGIDMAACKGTVVCAAADGVVLHARLVAGYGNMIQITHNETYSTRYAHLNTMVVKKGQKVKRGDKIGTVGDTGFTFKKGADASHLHFEVLKLGKQVNPKPLISSEG